MAPDKKLPADFKEFIQYYKDRVYERFISYIPAGEPKEFINMVRSYVDRKGQYRRPSYVILWSLLHSGDENMAILPAAIQQASEDYFLMHDDWMDNNTLRRGLPSAHVLYGPVYTILAGDVLNTVLWKMAYDVALQMKPNIRDTYFNKLYDMMLVTHIGQYYDISLTNELKDITKFSSDDYYKSIYAKSAYYSVFGPMQCGAIIAGASESEINKIPDYGTPAGTAFQIKDDILDCISEEKVLGKAIGNDIYEGTKTLILWHAVQNASTKELEKLKQIYKKSRESKTKDDVSFVLKTFNNLGSIQFAQKKADDLIKQALAKFESASRKIPESQIKELARNSIGYVAKRNK